MPPLELNDEMYERLVTLISEARVAALSCQQEVKILREERDRDYRELNLAIGHLSSGSRMLSEGFKTIEEDLTEIQKELRTHSSELKEVQEALREQAAATQSMAAEISKLAQSVDGITQLTKSNFDQLESFRSQVLDGEAKISHGTETGGRPR